MNFQELYNRMRELDKPVVEEPNEGNAYGQAVQNTPKGQEIKINGKGTGDIKREDSLANECGPDMASSSSPAQQDNVSMNVNMSGSGAGGIRDLIDILKNIEGEHGGEDDLGKMIGNMDHTDHDHEEPGMDMAKKTLVIGDDQPVDEYANEPQETNMPLPMAGDDLHRPHGAYPATQPGDNPMAVARIRETLEKLYSSMK